MVGAEQESKAACLGSGWAVQYSKISGYNAAHLAIQIEDGGRLGDLETGAAPPALHTTHCSDL